MVNVLYGGILGLLAGLAFNRITLFQIKRRTSETAQIEAVDNLAVIISWILLSGVLFAVVFARFQSTALRLEYVAYISIALSVGVVDLDIRRIPNWSVLALLIVRTAAIVYGIVWEKGTVKEYLFPSLIGLAIGFVLFQLPSLIGIPIGSGDVKYCGAIGYCLGIFGYLQASIIMAISLAAYLIYLVVTKKGSLKTAVPMGPYLSLGVVITVICPMFEKFNSVFTVLK